jgi:exodeoxyribonuclease III
MLITSWNVNSLRVRLEQVLRLLREQQPDVLALQETKLQDADFPVAAFEAAGYQCLYAGQKTYNGVAIVSRTPPGEVLMQELDAFPDPQRRVLLARIRGVEVLNLYVPNGSEVGSEKYAYKLAWLEALERTLRARPADVPRVVLGDFNIAPADEDVHDPAAWSGRILCSDAERRALDAICSLGYADCFRRFQQAAGSFSWWDYRAAGFRRNLGLRIDLVLASNALAKRCVASGIEREARGWEQPSDHAPVWARFELEGERDG